MRKKLLLAQIDALTDSYRKCASELNALKTENERLQAKICELEEQLKDNDTKTGGFTVELSSENADTQKNDDKPIINETVELDESLEYGAQIIGKIIVDSAKYTDTITSNPNENTKDMINLIMGKSEICKSEILNIAISQMDFDTKCQLMDSQYTEAIDYFKSVMAQG